MVITVTNVYNGCISIIVIKLQPVPQYFQIFDEFEALLFSLNISKLFAHIFKI